MAQFWRSVAENSTERRVTSWKMDVKKNTESSRLIFGLFLSSHRYLLFFFIFISFSFSSFCYRKVGGRRGKPKATQWRLFLFIENIIVFVFKNRCIIMSNYGAQIRETCMPGTGTVQLSGPLIQTTTVIFTRHTSQLFSELIWSSLNIFIVFKYQTQPVLQSFRPRMWGLNRFW